MDQLERREETNRRRNSAERRGIEKYHLLPDCQKKSAETLEKDIETLTEQIKRFQKERHEAIASQTPEEVIAAIETEKANATRLAEEAKLSLAAKEEVLLSTQNKN